MKKKLDAFHMLITNINLLNINPLIKKDLKTLARLTYTQGSILGRKFQIKRDIDFLMKINDSRDFEIKNNNCHYKKI